MATNARKKGTLQQMRVREVDALQGGRKKQLWKNSDKGGGLRPAKSKKGKEEGLTVSSLN